MLVSLCFYHTAHYDCQDFHNHESFTCFKFFVRVTVLGIVTVLQFWIWIQECTFESHTERFKSHFTLHVCQQRLCQVTSASLCSLGNTNFSFFNLYSLLLVLLHCSLADCNLRCDVMS
jgi:hypothetical protein